ncbi:MAG: OmpA family protein, partial [Leptospiraceae bacterium]|nr:OmpA family protein [Leptospiraceae bacterium]
DQYNRQLSEQRARSVVRELQREHGVDNRRMSFHGYGESRPVAPNTTPEGRARNRRVEVLIVTE